MDLPRQRELFRRWTTSSEPYPHEALVGLLALLHGVSSQEARMLVVDDIDTRNRKVQLGQRPNPAALDPAGWAALQRCLAYRETQRTSNPHVIVTGGTKANFEKVADDSQAAVCTLAGKRSLGEEAEWGRLRRVGAGEGSVEGAQLGDQCGSA